MRLFPSGRFWIGGRLRYCPRSMSAPHHHRSSPETRALCTIHARPPHRTLLAVAFLALAVGCTLDDEPKSGCRDDNDCLRGRTCMSGTCRDRVQVLPVADGSSSDALGPTDAPIAEENDAGWDVSQDPSQTRDDVDSDAAIDAMPQPEASADFRAAPSVDAVPDLPADAGPENPGDAGPPTFPRAYSSSVISPYSLEIVSEHPPGIALPRPHRLDFFAIPATGRLWHMQIVDGVATREPQVGATTNLTGGADATSWDVGRWDVVVRGTGDVVWHAYAQLEGLNGWFWESLGAMPGSLRPTIAHVGPGNLVVFQLDAAGSTTLFKRMSKGIWAAWKAGATGAIAGGLDATTLSEGVDPRLIRLVARSHDDRLVTAVYDPASDTMGAWQDVGGEPLDGVAGTPAITSLGPTTDDYEVLTPSSTGRVWKRSFARSADEADFAAVGNLFPSVVVDVDVAAVPSMNRMDVHLRTKDGELQHTAITATAGKSCASAAVAICGRGATGLACAELVADGGLMSAEVASYGLFQNDVWHMRASDWGSIRYGDVNADGRDDACGRNAQGVWCALGTGATTLITGKWTSEFGDTGWEGDRAYWGTLQLVDIDGDRRADICGRDALGIRCAISTGTSFRPAGLPRVAAFTDAAGWKADPSRWATVQFPDLDGDQKADVCGRDTTGVICGLSDGSSFAPPSLWQGGLSDALGGNETSRWETTQFPDVDGDGRADLCARSPEGIHCGRSDGRGAFTDWKLWTTAFGRGEWGTSAAHYATIQFPDLNADGRADICGRGQEGLICALSTGTSFASATSWSAAFSDAAGWTTLMHAGSIQFPDFNGDGKPDVCGRGAAGVRCAPSNGHSAFGPPGMTTLFQDSDGWSRADTFPTIGFPALRTGSCAPRPKQTTGMRPAARLPF